MLIAGYEPGIGVNLHVGVPAADRGTGSRPLLAVR
jgi:hypothetical protein